DAKPLAALRSLDRNGRVIYVGSFSKTLFPALRLGYLIMPPGLRDDFTSAKWLEDLGTSAIEQSALAHFIAQGGFERHMRRSSRTLKERRMVLIEGLRRCGHGNLEIADSHAGMHLVLWMNDFSLAQGEAFIAHARSRGLGLHAITPCYLNPPDRFGLLMGYGGLSVVEIEQALVIFEQCLQETSP
ncbi:MAG TPA: aminotransferase class I/II-fold pyridoxal phosphate-dependent enzyme, partial [Pseudoxanthomonas sp.]|nr:aminotransferase class I/II-fold pyridoxal phosphate-dependent enzyme [Pseudoxanthomonas sp.]